MLFHPDAPPRCHRIITILILITTYFNQVSTGPRYSSRIVALTSGSIRGIIVELNSRHLQPVEVFRGVPYAAPPVGALRYRLPEPVQMWTGTRLADSYGPVCPQRYPDISNKTKALGLMPRGRYIFLKKFVPMLARQNEDCLFLNIYVPGNGNEDVDAPYAVMFFIHGESFEWGSGNVYDGSVLASHGHVIFITVNFRLGILGFLRTKPISNQDEENVSGDNLALHDLLAALRWTQTNIGAFGGDRTRVTLLGHDTGAALVNLLLLEPSAKDLFHRAILLSGTALSPWASIHDAENSRMAIAEQTNCPTDTDMVSCLQEQPLEKLLSMNLEAPRFMPRFAPVLPLDPAYIMEQEPSAHFNRCELMLGVASTESYNDFSAAEIQYGFEEDQRNRVLRTYIRNAYVYHLNEIFSAVRNEYTDWEKPVQHPINIRDSTMEALSDGHTVAPLVRVAFLHAKSGAKTFLFHFGYQTKESDYPQRLGSVRGEALTYLTGLPLVGGAPYFPHNFSRQDTGVAEAMLGFIANFAKSGDPNERHAHYYQESGDFGATKERTRYRGLNWDNYDPRTQFYLSITAKPKMKSHYRGHKMALWLNLIPQLHQPGDEDVSMRHHHFHEREQHYYAGTIRAESFTRAPPFQHYPSSILTLPNPQLGAKTECIPDPTTDSQETFQSPDDVTEDNLEFFHRLASKHYFSYAAALAITISVGCLLLFLNMIIFAGIYYQKGRSKKKPRRTRSSSSPSTDDIQLSSRTNPSCSSRHQSPTIEKRVIKIYEPPPCYNNATLPKCPANSSKSKPLPPMRTSSNPPDVTMKKRVQVQEISV